MSDLSGRLRSKGICLPWDQPAVLSSAAKGPLSSAAPSLFAPVERSAPSKTSSCGGRVELRVSSSCPSTSQGQKRPAPVSAPKAEKRPASLGLSESLKHSLFTPLIDQGAKAIAQENKVQAECQDDLLESVRSTLSRWVQECLVKEDKIKKFVDKGVMKCRVQAKWSEGLADQMKKLARKYGAKLLSDSDKENAPKHVAWLAHDEKWLFGFDAAAFETFLGAHPEALDPPSSKVRLVAEECATMSRSREELVVILQQRFGSLRQATQSRAKKIVSESISAKRKAVTLVASDVRHEDQIKARIESSEDVAWAAATLAPMGLKASGEAVIRVPPVVVLPLLEGLGALNQMPDILNMLRQHGIGKIVAAYRHHPQPDVAKAAKELVSSWRAACKDR